VAVILLIHSILFILSKKNTVKKRKSAMLG
jgi:hypothetical protein